MKKRDLLQTIEKFNQKINTHTPSELEMLRELKVMNLKIKTNNLDINKLLKEKQNIIKTIWKVAIFEKMILKESKGMTKKEKSKLLDYFNNYLKINNGNKLETASSKDIIEIFQDNLFEKKIIN